MPAYAWDPNLKPNPAVLAAVQSTFREEGLLTYDADVPAAKLVDGSYARRVATIR
jgi:hypothetical protein